MKNISRQAYILATLLVLLLFVNCQKEDLKTTQTQEVLTKALYKQRTVTLKDIPKIEQKVIEKLNPEVFNRTEGSNTNQAIFDTENVLEIIDTLNNANYSFQFRFPDTPISTFYNLIVGETPTGEVLTPYVMKYRCDDENLENYIANGLDFKYFVGTMSIHKYTDYFALGEFDRTETLCPTELDSVGDPISCSEDSVDGSSGWCIDGNNGPGDGNSGGGSNGSSVCTNEIYVTDCNGDNTDNMHPLAECGGPDKATATRHNVWECGGQPILSPNQEEDTLRTVNDDCPSCGTPIGGVVINPVDISTMRTFLKDNLDLSYDGLNFIGNNNNPTSIESVNSTYFLLQEHLNPLTNAPLELAKTYSEEIIETGGDGNLVKASPFVKYPEGSNYETLYPKLTSVLKNDLPKIANNQRVIDAIHGITDAPKEKIKEALQWGKGPEIHIEELWGEGDAKRYGAYRGHYNEADINKLFLHVDLVNEFENSNITEISDALAFLIAVTILHEYNHLGDTVFGNSFWGELYDENPYDPTNEAGLVFEVEMFGEAVWKENAGLILIKSGGF